MGTLSLLPVLSCFLFLFCITPSSSQKITSLPLYTGPALSQYSGYININSTNKENIFYWLIESQRSPATDPLVVWFQGGPGCSSLYGLFEENGPFRVDDSGNLTYNSLHWATISNVLYVDAPLGVGFSYSASGDYKTNDNQTADRNYLFLQGFLKQYPQYVERQLWISGESYAGVYVPTLAYRLLTGQSSALRTAFSGMVVGNPVLGCPNEGAEAYQMNIFYWHGLVSEQVYSEFKQAGCDTKTRNHTACSQTYRTALNQIGELDPDNLYQDFCTGNASLQNNVEIPSHCNVIDDRTTAYLNRADVQAAIHAQPTRWDSCSNIPYTWNAGSMMPYWESFFALKPSLRILIYSGDVDVGTCPFPFTMKCLQELNRTAVKEWGPWFVNGVTAGYFQEFDRFTYATVKGAGHEVPLYQPLSAYFLYSRFVQGELFVKQQDLKMVAAKSIFQRTRQSQMLAKHRQKFSIY